VAVASGERERGSQQQAPAQQADLHGSLLG
jgi:hypothetical protein